MTLPSTGNTRVSTHPWGRTLPGIIQTERPRQRGGALGTALHFLGLGHQHVTLQLRRPHHDGPIWGKSILCVQRAKAG